MELLKVVKKAKRGNVRAFERLIHEYKTMMYRVARTIVVNDSDCDDVIQESILKAYENINELREPAYFKTWLIRIVINECHGIHRKNKKVVEIHDAIVPAAIEQGFEMVEVELLLALLSEEEGKLLKLFHIKDISIKDLAAIYGVPENTIKTRLRRARVKAREILEKEVRLNWKNGKTN